MVSPIKLGYVNCQGLTVQKMSHIESLLSSQTYHIIICAEHWFPVHVHFNNSDYYLCSSPQESFRTVGHQNGGLVMFAAPHIRQLITIHQFTFFSITFSIGPTRISTVYYPPRLTDQNILDVINSENQNSSIWLGDFNFRLGDLTNDKSTSNLNRFKSICQRLPNLYLIPNSSIICPRTDHVLSSQDILWTYEHTNRLEFSTDHGWMKVMIHMDHISPNETTLPLWRLDLGPLNHKVVRQSLIGTYERTASPIIDRILGSLFNLRTMNCSYKNMGLVLDSAYQCFTDIIHQVAISHLKMYDATKAHQGTSARINSWYMNNTTAIREFKKSKKKISHRNFVISRDASKPTSTEAYEHFCTLYESSTSMESSKEYDLSFLDLPDDLAINFITIKEFIGIIENYSSSKSGGPDMIHTPLIKCLIKSNIFSQQLFRLNLFMFQIGKTPEIWNTSNIYLIPKKDGHCTVQECRPISLTPILRRFFELAILKVQSKLNHPSFMLSENQSAFRYGHSSTLQALKSEQMSKSGNKISVFLDLKSAYDKVQHNHLFQILHKRQVPVLFKKLFYSLMSHKTKSYVIINAHRIERPIWRKCGLFQGSILSPLLFNIFIDELACSSPSILLYADDIVLKSTNLAQAQSQLRLCEEWSKAYDMTWNLSKCGLVGTDEPLFLNGDPIPIVNEYKYLGFPHNEMGILPDKLMKSNLDKHDSMLRSFLTQREKWSFQTKRSLYLTYVNSMLNYGSGCFAFWLERQVSSTKETWLARLNQSHDLMLDFLFGSHYKKILLSSLACIPQPEQKLELWKAFLYRQVSKSNMTHSLLNSSLVYGIQSNRNFFLHLLQSSKLVLDFTQLNNSRRKADNITWKYFTRSTILQDFLKQPGILQHYIRPRGRLAGSKMDGLFAAKSLVLQTRCFQWRTNTAFMNKNCICGQRFVRTHVDSCLWDTLTDIEFRQLKNEYQQSSDHDDIQRELALKKGKNESKYTILDYCLNTNLTKFNIAYTLILHKLV